MSVKSKPYHAAPLPRDWTNSALPIVRAFIGAVFVAYSAQATVFLVASDLQGALANSVSLALFADRYWLGIAAALLFFIGQILTAEKAPAIWWCLLVPDAFYTARDLQPRFEALVAAAPIGALVVLAGAAGLAFAANRWGARWYVAAIALAAASVGWLVAQVSPPTVYAAWCFAALHGYLIARLGETLLFGLRSRAEE